MAWGTTMWEQEDLLIFVFPLQFVLSALEESGLKVIKHTLLAEKDSIEMQNDESADTETTAFFTAIRSK